MSRAGDHVYDMPNDLSDEVIEAFLLGTPDPGWQQDEALAGLAGHMAVALAGPDPSPDQALLQLFWANGAAVQPAPVGPRRLRALAAAALGTASLILGVGAAGAAGVLPAPVQRAVAHAVDAVTPFHLPEPTRHEPARGAPDAVANDGGTAVTNGEPSVPPAVGPPSTTPSGQTLPPTGPGATGTDRARQTPAGDAIPPQVPVTPGGQPPVTPGTPTPPTVAPGRERVGQTPASSVVPSSVPAKAPTGRP